MQQHFWYNQLNCWRVGILFFTEFIYRDAGGPPSEGPPDGHLLHLCHGCYSFAVELQTWHPEGSQLLSNSVCGQMKSSCRHLCSGEKGWKCISIYCVLAHTSHDFLLLYSPSHLRLHDSQQILPVELHVQGGVSSGTEGGQHGLSVWGGTLEVSISTANIMQLRDKKAGKMLSSAQQQNGLKRKEEAV